MFSSRIGQENKYDLSAPVFLTAFKFLERKDLNTLPLGWIELDDGVRASVQAYESFDENEVFFESHEKYFDVQYVVSGEEYCHVTAREGLTVKVPYDAEMDITFYEDNSKYSQVFLGPGDFIVLSPDDVHKPRVKAGDKTKIKKIVVKVPVK